MRRVPLEAARPGQKLAAAVNYGGRTILASGVVLNEEMLKTIRSLGIRQITVVDSRFEGISPAASLPQAVREWGLKILGEIFREQEENGAGGAQIPLSSIAGLATEIDSQLSVRPGRPVTLIEDEPEASYLPVHSLNVAVLAMAVARQAGYTDRIIDIGIGALLHDLGMVNVPRELRERAGPLAPAEWDIIRRHPEAGFRALAGHPAVSNFAKVIVVQHHEREDGSGYPRGTQGKDIYPFAKLVAICDAYAAMVAERPYRGQYLPHQAMEFLMSGAGYEFDHTLVQHFCKCVAPYPVGTMVVLNTGETGIVVDVERGYLSRPTVRVITDRKGQELVRYYELNLSAPINHSSVIVDVVRE